MIKKNGFTLTELLISTVIFGLVSSVAVPSYYKMIEQGRSAEAKANLKAIYMAQSVYRLKNGQFWNPGVTNIGTVNSVLNLDISGKYYTDNIKITGNATAFQANMERTGSSTWTVSINETGQAWEWNGISP